MRTPLISSLKRIPTLAVHITHQSLGVCSEFVDGVQLQKVGVHFPSSGALPCRCQALIREQ